MKTFKKKTFKEKNTFENRKAESERVMHKYPNRVPVIVKKVESSMIADIDRQKFLVPSDLTVGQFVFVIRKRLKLRPQEALFLFVGDIIPASAALISQIYRDHKDIDGFLYVNYSAENVFG